MGRIGFALAASAALVSGVVAASDAAAAERTATIQGVQDRALREAIERAVGEENVPPVSRNEARRRARAAADSAEALLRSEGYYAPVIEPDIGEGDRPSAVVKIDPGPRFRLKDPNIQWIGKTPDPESEIAAKGAIALATDAPGRAADVIAAEGRIAAILQARGYADAVATPRTVTVDHADHSVQPIFKLSSGELVHLDGIRLEGKSRTNPAWIEYLIPWKSGAVYRPNSVAELERRLLETQVYDSVTVALSPTSNPDGLRPVVVSLADRARRSLELSAGYSTSEGPDIDVKWSVFNRFRRADTVTAEFRYLNIDSRVGLDLLLPHWRKPGDNLKLTAEVFRQDTDAYLQTGAALRADLTNRFGTQTSYFTRGLSLIGAQVYDKHTGTVNIAVLAALGALALDRSDNPLNPSHGWKMEVRLEPTAITGDVTLAYFKAQASASTYFAFGSAADTVIAVRGHVGSILGGKIPDVPAAYRFFAGGGGSVRGYAYQGVGPRYSDDQPIGGLALIETSVEVRQKIWGQLGGVAFVDAGSVAKSMVPDFSNVSLGVGVGLRYNLGFAPIRADFAIPLNRPHGASPFQVYISIGQSF
ncbi:MAG: autotransporter assembly complex family protein [Caulobacteraceae bacterium]